MYKGDTHLSSDVMRRRIDDHGFDEHVIHSVKAEGKRREKYDNNN